MEKVYIKDKQGNKVLPKTHVSAVYDDEGNDLGSHLGAFEDEVRGLVDTPHQEYITVATYASLPASGSKDTIYRVSNYNGSTSQVDTASYSEYAWNGSQYIFLCVKSQIDKVFDITVYNSNTKYADLSAALGTNGANIPQNLRKGGMSVKYVQSSDNKYVQYRLMVDSFSTTVSDWQGVDDEPTAGSNNLVKSGGVKNSIDYVLAIETRNDLSSKIMLDANNSKQGLFVSDTGIFAHDLPDSISTNIFRVFAGEQIGVCINYDNPTEVNKQWPTTAVYYDEQFQFHSCVNINSRVKQEKIFKTTVPSGAAYCIISDLCVLSTSAPFTQRKVYVIVGNVLFDINNNGYKIANKLLSTDNTASVSFGGAMTSVDIEIDGVKNLILSGIYAFMAQLSNSVGFVLSDGNGNVLNYSPLSGELLDTEYFIDIEHLYPTAKYLSLSYPQENPTGVVHNPTIKYSKGTVIQVRDGNESKPSGALEEYFSVTVNASKLIPKDMFVTKTNIGSLEDANNVINYCYYRQPSHNKPVKLVIMTLGAGQNVTDHSVNVGGIEQLVAAGYAILVYAGYPIAAWGTLNNMLGNWTSEETVYKALEHINEKYDIDQNGYFVFGLSNGGLLGENLIELTTIPIRACAYFAPLLHMTWFMNYRQEMYTVYGMPVDGDWDEDYYKGRDCFTRNMSDVIDMGNYNPQNYTGLSYDDPLVTSHDVKKYRRGVPMLSLIGTDDGYVNPAPTIAYIRAIQNASGNAKAIMYDGLNHATISAVNEGETLYRINNVDMMSRYIEVLRWFERWGGEEINPTVVNS